MAREEHHLLLPADDVYFAQPARIFDSVADQQALNEQASVNGAGALHGPEDEHRFPVDVVSGHVSPHTAVAR